MTLTERPPRRRRRTSDPLGTRELILEEAMRLIARDGVEEMMLKDVADAVGIQPPSVYRHFVNREAIITALAARMMDELADFLTTEQDMEPVAWMERWARGLVWFFASRPAYVLMLLRDLATPSGFGPMTAAFGPLEDTTEIQGVVRINEAFRAVYQRGVSEKVFRPGIQQMFFSTVFGAVLVSLVWPYSGKRAAYGAQDLERLQSNVVAIALALIKQD